MKREIWRAIPAFRGWYAVSSRGRVKRVAAGKGTRAGRILKHALQTNGYAFLRLSRGTAKSRTLCRVHRLVAAAFIGPAAAGT